MKINCCIVPLLPERDPRWIWSKENGIQPCYNFPWWVFSPRWGHFTEAEKKDMMDRVLPTVLLVLQRPFSGRGRITMITSRLYILQCHVVATWQAQICLLTGPFSFFPLAGVPPLLQLFVKSGYWWHYTSLSQWWSMLCHPACSSLNTLTE